MAATAVSLKLFLIDVIGVNLYLFLTAITLIEPGAEIQLEDLMPNKIGSGSALRTSARNPLTAPSRTADYSAEVYSLEIWVFVR